jgi:hypothetical protein
MDIQPKKAVEYARIAMEMSEESDHNQAKLCLAHAYLKCGDIQNATMFLPQSDDVECLFVKGLIEYRNGLLDKAQDIWKAISSVEFDSIKYYHIKNKISKYCEDKNKDNKYFALSSIK